MIEPKYKTGDIVIIYDSGDLVKKEVYRTEISLYKDKPDIKYEFIHKSVSGGFIFGDRKYYENEVFESKENFIEEMKKRIL